MINDTNKSMPDNNVVDNDPLSVANIKKALKLPTTKRTRRVAEPHLRPHKIHGDEYYYFCQGSGPEIYLGSARFILDAVLAYKLASAKTTGMTDEQIVRKLTTSK